MGCRKTNYNIPGESESVTIQSNGETNSYNSHLQKVKAYFTLNEIPQNVVSFSPIPIKNSHFYPQTKLHLLLAASPHSLVVRAANSLNSGWQSANAI